MAKSTAVVSPNLGLYFDRPALALGSKMLAAGNNFRVQNHILSNLNLGWERFGNLTLNGPITLISNFFLRGGSEKLIFATLTDIYNYNAASDTAAFLTPRYQTGTASASGTAVTGVGTSWSANAAAGDEIHFGAADYTDPTGVWYEIDSVNSNTSITLTTSAGTVGAGAYTIRRKFTGDLDNIWSTAVFVNASPSNADEWWVTNGVNDIFRWNGTDTQLERMGSLGFTAKRLVVYSNMMIFLNINQGGTSKPTDMINSNVGEPQNVTTGLSEQFKVHGGSDEIMNARVLGDNLAIYNKDSVTLSQFVGGDLIFAFRQVLTGVGLIAPRAVADFGNFHEFLGADTQYTFDGVTVRAINRHVFGSILQQQDPTRVAFSYTHFDEQNGDLLWVVPSTVDPGSGSASAAPSRAFSEHYLEDVGQGFPPPFSQRDFPFTATGYFTRQQGLTWDQLTQKWEELNFRWNDQFFFAAYPLNMAGSVDGKIYTFNSVQNADGAALKGFVRFGRRAVIDGRNRGLVKRIYPFVQNKTTSLNVTLYMSDHGMGPNTITQTDVFDQTLPQGAHFTAPYRRGRFMQTEFGTDGPSQPWELTGYDTDVIPGGDR